MALDLTLSTIKVRGLAPGSVAVDPSNNIQASITPYGFGVSGSGSIQASLRSGASGVIQASIDAGIVDAPENPLACHVGQGTILLTWSHPDLPAIQYFELQASMNLAGPYVPYQRGRFPSTRGMVNNVPMGINAYFQLRSVGKNRTLSAFVQVKRGKLVSGTANFKVRSINGSQILKDAVFTSLDQETGQVVAIKAPSLITIQ